MSHKELGQRTIHAGAPRDGEVCLGVQFVALTGGKITASGAAPPGTAAVCDFWDRGRRQVTLHAGPARRGEELRQLQFYAWTEAQPELGTVPVYEWEHTHSRELSVHPAPPWPGEEPTAARVVFHALPPAAAYAVSLRARGRENSGIWAHGRTAIILVGNNRLQLHGARALLAPRLLPLAGRAGQFHERSCDTRTRSWRRPRCRRRASPWR